MKKLTEAEIHSLLVKMADNFDQEGNHELASSVDKTIKSIASRPKAPLKNLDDDVKKNLIIFVHDADEGTGKSIDGLKELFRRLRYFDLADSAKETGLDKLVKDMEKTKGGLCDAKKRLYEMMMGKRPSEQDLKDLAGNSADDGAVEQNALDFFESQNAQDFELELKGKDIDDEKLEKLVDSEEDAERIESMTPEMQEELAKVIEEEEEISEDELNDFLGSI